MKYVQWCGGSYEHEHDCGPHDERCDLSPPSPVCGCGRCGFERASGFVVDEGVAITFGDQPNVATLVVELDSGPQITIRETLVQT